MRKRNDIQNTILFLHGVSDKISTSNTKLPFPALYFPHSCN